MGRRSETWGRAAEDAAADWYARRGGRVVGRRARTAGGEIDLVVALGDALVFVEVKARKRRSDALEAVGARGQARLLRAVDCWLAEQGATPAETRIDLATVDGQGGVRVLENAVFG